MNSPFWQERVIKEAHEVAERNGFKLVEHRNYIGRISIVATKAPYADDTVIKALNDWTNVIIFFSGYEQLAFELKNTK